MRYPYDTKDARIQTAVQGINGTRKFPVHLKILDTEAVEASTTGVLDAGAMEEYDCEITENINNPEYPRALQVVGSNGGSADVMTIHGTNIAGEVIEEEFTMNGTDPVLGDKAFKTVTQIDLPGWEGDEDTVSVGWIDKLGLPYRLSMDTVIAAYHDGVLEDTPPTVAVDASDIEKNTVDLDTALDGNAVDIILLV